MNQRIKASLSNEIMALSYSLSNEIMVLSYIIPKLFSFLLQEFGAAFQRRQTM